jgi:hypothetical protein
VPVTVRPEAKKETAKIAATPGIPKPQATVRLQPRPQPTPAAASFQVQSVQPAISEADANEEIPMNIAVIAVVAAVVALAIQIWTMM